jgi:hypothetical protein
MYTRYSLPVNNQGTVYWTLDQSWEQSWCKLMLDVYCDSFTTSYLPTCLLLISLGNRHLKHEVLSHWPHCLLNMTKRLIPLQGKSWKPFSNLPLSHWPYRDFDTTKHLIST